MFSSVATDFGSWTNIFSDSQVKFQPIMGDGKYGHSVIVVFLC